GTVFHVRRDRAELCGGYSRELIQYEIVWTELFEIADDTVRVGPAHAEKFRAEFVPSFCAAGEEFFVADAAKTSRIGRRTTARDGAESAPAPEDFAEYKIGVIGRLMLDYVTHGCRSRSN